MSDSASFIGQQIDQYHIIEHIARGGMADVYLAEDVNLNRLVAVKVLNIPTYPPLTRRFEREAQVVARLNHPNIVQIFSIGRTPKDLSYIAMQYIEGGSLQEKLEQLADRGKLLTTVQALHIARQIALALDVAHQAHIVHRDLKPSNILIHRDGTPILVDLGIAVVGDGSRITQTGRIIGTPSYMSPEQVRAVALDGRSDIYSLGIILYEMLAGIRPFEAGESFAVLYKQAYEEPVPLDRVRPDLSIHTCQIVERCLKKEPAQRYQNAQALVAAIDMALQAEGSHGPNPQATQVLTHLEDSDLISRRQVVQAVPAEADASGRKVPIWAVVTLLVLVSAVVLAVLSPSLRGNPSPFPTNTHTPVPNDTPTPSPTTDALHIVSLTPTPILSKTKQSTAERVTPMVLASATSIPLEVAALNLAENSTLLELQTTIASRQLGYGSFDFTMPMTLTLDQSASARLSIQLDENFVQTSFAQIVIDTTPATTFQATNKQPQYVITEEITLFERMSAALSGVNFDISPDIPADKTILPNNKTTWTWTIAPQRAGYQTVRLEIFIQLNDNNEDTIWLYDNTLQIYVQEANPPQAIPNVNITLFIVTAVGLIVLLLLIYIFFRASSLYTGQTTTTTLNINLSQFDELHQLIYRHFNKPDVRDLCYRLDIKYDDLSAGTLNNKIWQLIDHCHRHGRTSELIGLCSEMRPHVTWQEAKLNQLSQEESEKEDQ